MKMINDFEEAKEVLRDRLEKARNKEEHRLTNKEIARRAEISPSHVDGIMRGQNLPSLEKLVRISLVLEEDPMDLAQGLEQFIKPVGFKFEEWGPEEVNEYQKLTRALLHKIKTELAEKSLYIPKDRKEMIFTGGRIPMDDNAMAAAGMPKGSIVHWTRKKDALIDGELYFVQFESYAVIRRIYKLTDKIILLPSTILSKDDIEVRELKDLLMWGIPYKVEINL